MSHKYATIGGSREFLPTSRILKDSVSPIPRSSTDQNIRYGGLAANLIAPPSPTPPHSLIEARGLGYHARISNRDFPSLQTYTHHPSHRSEDQNSLSSSRLNSSYSSTRFRGVWGVKSKPAKLTVTQNVPNPCLRESSV